MPKKEKQPEPHCIFNNPNPQGGLEKKLQKCVQITLQ
jgi:hypothetical protein